MNLFDVYPLFDIAIVVSPKTGYIFFSGKKRGARFTPFAYTYILYIIIVFVPNVKESNKFLYDMTN